MKIRSINTNSGSLPTSKMEFFVMIVNSIAKRPMLEYQEYQMYQEFLVI